MQSLLSSEHVDPYKAQKVCCKEIQDFTLRGLQALMRGQQYGPIYAWMDMHAMSQRK